MSQQSLQKSTESATPDTSKESTPKSNNDQKIEISEPRSQEDPIDRDYKELVAEFCTDKTKTYEWRLKQLEQLRKMLSENVDKVQSLNALNDKCISGEKRFMQIYDKLNFLHLKKLKVKLLKLIL